MSDSIPLGERESLRLEFKGLDALEDPEKIAREVVAMLNAEGGEVWIGLREDGGRAIAVEDIPDPIRETRRLLDHLVDTIEPPVSDREVTIKALDEGGGTVLRVRVNSEPEKGPYAFLKGLGRYFVVRVGDRIRQMSREEIFRDPGSDRKTVLRDAAAKVLAEREKILMREHRRFWLFFAPAAPVSLDIHAPKLEEFLQNPQLTGNRLSGWNFSKFQFRPLIKAGTFKTSPEDFLEVEIRRDGGLLFAAPLDSLYWKGDKNQIWPPVLIEYIVSAVRLAAAIYRGTLQPEQPVLADLAMAGVKGWTLRPGTPGVWCSASRSQEFVEADDLLLTQPLVFRFEDMDAEPDRCGYRLIERVYEAFGLRREDIPKLFDLETGRLVLPE